MKLYITLLALTLVTVCDGSILDAFHDAATYVKDKVTTVARNIHYILTENIKPQSKSNQDGKQQDKYKNSGRDYQDVNNDRNNLLAQSSENPIQKKPNYEEKVKEDLNKILARYPVHLNPTNSQPSADHGDKVNTHYDDEYPPIDIRML